MINQSANIINRNIESIGGHIMESSPRAGFLIGISLVVIIIFLIVRRNKK